MNVTTMNQLDVNSVELHGKNEDGNEPEILDDEVFIEPDKVAEHILKQMKDVVDNTTTAVAAVDDAAAAAADDGDHKHDDDDDDSSHDENSHLKQLRPGQNSSIRRNDSFNSFLTRSERNAIIGKDPAPTEQEAAKRRIRFRDTIAQVFEFEKVDKAVRHQYWMTDEDFERIETDIRITHFRHTNARSGKIPFDDVNNSIRGLETVFGDVDVKLYKHRQSVLQEIHQQKSTHGYVKDWEKVRHTSEVHSNSCRQKAMELAKQDEIEHDKAWGILPATTATAEKLISKVKLATNAVQTKLESKKKNPFLFWKKK